MEFENLEKYENSYSDSAFHEKIKKIGRKIGIKLLCYVLALHQILKEENIPLTEKSMIIGALGYFILPIDVIPDFMLGVGYTDDILMVYSVLSKVKKYTNEDIIRKVYETVNKYFEDVTYEEIKKYLV